MTRVTSLDVRCPACGVGPGARCRRLDDLDRSTAPHDLRRLAAREEQARLNPEHVDGQLPLFGRKAAS